MTIHREIKALFLFLRSRLEIPGLQFTLMPNIPDQKLNKNSQIVPSIKSCPKQACPVYKYAREKLGGNLELADSSFKYVLKHLSLYFTFGPTNKRAQFFSRGITEMLISNWWQTE